MAISAETDARVSARATASERPAEHGSESFSDRSRRPARYANQPPQQVESLIVTLKRDKPHWGARKIRELLLRRLASHVPVPAKSAIHAVLDRHGLVKRIGKAPSCHRNTAVKGDCAQ